VHCASREKAKDGGFIGEGREELVDLILDVGDGICKEAFGKLAGTHWLPKDAEASSNFDGTSCSGIAGRRGRLGGEGGDGLFDAISDGISITATDGRDGGAAIRGGKDPGLVGI
jgi:hypothetical protein